MKKAIVTLTAFGLFMTSASAVMADGTSKEEVKCREVYGQGTVCDKVHKPEDTALGDNVYVLVFSSFAAATILYTFSKKLAV